MLTIYCQMGKVLRKLRHKRQHSLATLSEETGFTSTSLSRYETGAQQIPVHILCKLLAYYNQSITLEPMEKIGTARKIIFSDSQMALSDPDSLLQAV